MPRSALLKHGLTLARWGTGIGESNTLCFPSSSRFLGRFFGSGHEASQHNRLSFGLPAWDLGESPPTRLGPQELRILTSARPTSEGLFVIQHGPQETFGPLIHLPENSSCNKFETGASQEVRPIMRRTI